MRPPGSTWLKDTPEGELYKPTTGQFGFGQEILAKYNPGVKAQEFTIENSAKFIPAGSGIVFDVIT